MDTPAAADRPGTGRAPAATQTTQTAGTAGTPHVASGADIDVTAEIGPGTSVWHLAQIREHARVGAQCVIGRGAYVGPGVVLGDRVKLQNHALVYEPARLEDGVFVGPAAVLTNDRYPRSVDPEGALKRGGDWDPLGVTVCEGASVGARAVLVAGVTVGRWAMVAAGAVVTHDVADHALVAGVPARRIRWVGRAGVPLVRDTPAHHPPSSDARTATPRRPAAGRVWRCPRTGTRYLESDDTLVEAPPDGSF